MRTDSRRRSIGSQSGIATVRKLAGLFLFALCLAVADLPAATFVVNSPADVHDANPGDGKCETAAGNHICTLRAAIEESNSLAGADTILLQANVTYLLSLTDTVSFVTADLLVLDDVTIIGAGPSSTIIDGNGTGQRIFVVFQCIGNASDGMGGCMSGKNLSASMSGLTIKNGFSANLAGGILSNGKLALTNVAVTDNIANGLNDWGGGIYSSGSLTMTNCLLANNKTGAHNAYGGGMYSQGELTITDSTISGNSTLGGGSSPGWGGGLFLVSAATVFIRNSTVSDNSAAIGGGIYQSGGALVLINDTISGNSSAGTGGGLYNKYGDTGLYNVTVSQNVANADGSGFGSGGGLSNGTGTLMLINSIVAGNEVIIPTKPLPTLGVDECAGTITSQGYNIIEFVDADNCTVNGAYSTANPLLGPLQFNGGFTQTRAISPGSAAIDAGNPSGCTDNLGATITTDQRGVHRPYGTACDIGAFEYADIIFKNGFEH